MKPNPFLPLRKRVLIEKKPVYIQLLGMYFSAPERPGTRKFGVMLSLEYGILHTEVTCTAKIDRTENAWFTRARPSDVGTTW